MKPRRRYSVEDQHKIFVLKQQKTLLLVQRNMKEANKKQKAQTDKKSQDDDFQVWDPVTSRTTKEKPHCIKRGYHITDHRAKGLVSFVVRNQLTG